jgi:hypothetical protein
MTRSLPKAIKGYNFEFPEALQLEVMAMTATSPIRILFVEDHSDLS